MKYIIWSDSVDDLLWESGSLREVRRAIKAMAAMSPEDGDHRYFPILICRENRRSPYRRNLQILERHTLTGSEKYERAFMREHGETPVGTDAPEVSRGIAAPEEIRVIEAPRPAPGTRQHCAWFSCSRLFIKADRRYTYCGRPDCPATRQVPEYAQPANEALDALNDAAHARDLAAREQERVAIAAEEDAAYADQRSHGWAGTDDLMDDGDTDAQIDWRGVHGVRATRRNPMVPRADLDILQYGHVPNVIITADIATRYDADQDCGKCHAWQRAHHIALAPSYAPSGYRVVPLCVPCTNALVASGRAIDRRTV
jgi:hypothetical protein